jgi:hypothetical protein
MISANIDTTQLIRHLNNAVSYSNGFLQGAQMGKPKMLTNLGLVLKELVGEFIDASARMDPKSLHHVYEWYQVGSPEARLFDIDYRIIGGGLSVDGTLTQSRSLSRGSSEPFYNKAKIMEYGIPVTITPVRAQALRFEIDGQEVYTKNPVKVDNPGGTAVVNSFQETFKLFFITYASQALLEISGLANELRRPTEFARSFAAGVKGGGKALGVSAGMRYIGGGR